MSDEEYSRHWPERPATPESLVERSIQRLRDNIARREANEDVEALKAVLIEMDRLVTALSLAQTEIKGHMRVEDELQARIAELERILRLYQGGRRGWEKEGMLAGEWLKIQEQFDAAVNEVLKDRA